MPKAENRETKFTIDTQGIYLLYVQVILDESWAERLGGMHITTGASEGQERVTTLTGPLVDQAELAGVRNLDIEG